jgi:hypothetical protein
MFNVCKGSLANWKKNTKVQEMIDEFNKQSNVLKFKKDIDFHFTQMAIKEADAARVKLWKQLYEGWTDTQKLEMSGEIDIGISELAKSLQKIYEIATENNNPKESNKGNS